MAILTTEERLALLLNVLGQDAEAAALKSMHPTRALFVSKLLEEYKESPPSGDEVDYIVDDFAKYFSFAMTTLKPEVAKAQKDGQATDTDQPAAAAPDKLPQTLQFRNVEESGDYRDDLNQLDAFQIATALEKDHPKTIALVLNQLSTTLAAAIIKQLDDELRRETVVYLSHGSIAPDAIIRNIIKTTFLRANAIKTQKEEVNQADVLAKLMRSLPKDMRVELIEKLTEANEEIVGDIVSKLYVFDDVLRLNDRDAQKLIAETGSDFLIVAMQRVDPAIKAKLLDNLSKRARQSLEVEIEFKTNVSDEEIEEARKQFVQTLGKLDEAGEITLT
jgi:flagellar motor switch protein FliG